MCEISENKTRKSAKQVAIVFYGCFEKGLNIEVS